MELLDECSKQAASMWGKFEGLMPTQEHKEEKEKLSVSQFCAH